MAYSLMSLLEKTVKEVIDLVEQYLVASPDLIVDVRTWTLGLRDALLETDSC
jgi:hypothetical protein